MLRLFVLGILGILALAWPEAATAQQRPLRVVATVSMIADAVRAVGGDRVDVTSLLGEGVDPHTYRPTRADIAKLSSADFIVANGLHLEAQLEQTLKTLAASKPVLFAAEKISPERLLAHEEYNDRKDPHVWMDPKLWSVVVEAVRDELIVRDPAGKATFEAGAKTYLAEMQRIDDYARRVLATVPAGSRVLVTAHDAFGYFGRAYGFEVKGIQGLSTESEAGLKRIEELVSMLVAKKIRAVFVESSVPERNVRALVEGARARGHQVIVGGELYSDALGAPGSYEGTLVGMLDHNVTIISRALGGQTPLRGLNGKLKSGS